MKLVVLAACLTLVLPRAYAQEYSYTHYDISDGLAGSTVYCITQDKDGFIWLGTATGVSRFDGTHFHNYTAVDGLPDVEILEMFGDSKGRVWMAPFGKSICYYYKGKIHNQDNDSLLHQLRFSTNIDRFAEDASGNILVQERTRLHLLGYDGSVRVFDTIGRHPIDECAAAATGGNGQFLVQVGNEIYSFSGKGFTPYYPIHLFFHWPVCISMNSTGVIWRKDSLNIAMHSFVTGKTATIISPLSFHVTFSVLDDSLFYHNEFSGTTEYNLRSGSRRRLLEGRQVSRIFRDATGNSWFTTLDQGLYRLNSDEFRTIRLRTTENRPVGVTAFGKMGDILFAGGDQNDFFVFRPSDMKHSVAKNVTNTAKNPVLGFGRLPNDKIYVTTDNGLAELNGDFSIGGHNPTPLGLKSVQQVSKDRLLFAAYWGVAFMDLNSFLLTDTLWRDRATTVFYRNDTAFIGTLAGLYAVAANRSSVFLGKNIPFLQKRISTIASSPDGMLWIASYDGGVVGYQDGRVVATFNRQRGLTSDICRCLFVHDNILWIGTDKGLNRVSLDKPGYPVVRYTSQDGLGSDMINCVYADGPVVYVGTPAGLSFFDETKVDKLEGCRLYLLSVVNSNRERITDTAGLLLPYADRHLRVEFAGISYRSVGDVTYRYRLLGLDSNWRTTKETFLEYQALPSGRYQLQLQAMNKFGSQSDLQTLRFTVETPWWQTIWFDALVFLAAVSLTWFFVSLRISRIRYRQKEKEMVSQRMMELENMALQAQMNPHFIFNCLNSIQQHVFDGDIFAANKSISGLARLVRATLQHSSRAFIPLTEEINYLSQYLSLEKLRFKEKLDYAVEADPALFDGHYIIPPMLIQPYAENSVRHGIRHKTDGKGFIQIKFQRTGDRLTVTVEDNGIGREKAAGYKTREHIEYQSKGMSLTADRIRMINAKFNDPISIEIFDLADEAGRPAGTRVVVQLPLFHLFHENETI